LDAVFGVNLKRGAAEVATASGSVPAEKRRKVSERYYTWQLFVKATDSWDVPIVRR
jgi:hypothetical protein